jgi:membrane protease YdiL (CAAX protease family)
MMVRHAITGGKSPGLANVYPWEYTLVWWEDLVFSFPILLAMNKWGRNKWTISLAVVLSLLFGSGHIYHGLTGALTTCIYPYFISYRYSKKTSLGTVMVCHVMYDLMLFYSVRVLM